LIDEFNFKGMTLDGWKNPVTGQPEGGTSLRELLAKCSDFVEELQQPSALPPQHDHALPHWDTTAPAPTSYNHDEAVWHKALAVLASKPELATFTDEHGWMPL